MIAAKDGFIADFKIGYMQLATVEHQAEVIGGADVADGLTGFAVGRLVILARLSDGSCHVKAAANVTASSIGTATHIVAQSDDSLHNTQDSLIQVEKGITRNRNILGNTSADTPSAATSTMKTISLWKITNSDDIKIIPVAPATVSVRR
jgi:hypothetical protein